MHSNIGYIVTLCLNLSLLIPLANNPKVDNYVIVLFEKFSRFLYINLIALLGPMPIGF